MKPFEHLRLSRHKGLESASLLQLGKINVLCGPNNSGKSTIMECVANDKLHTIGKTFQDHEITEIAEESQKGYGWGTEARRKFFENINSAFREQEVWFADQCEDVRIPAMRNWQYHFSHFGEPTMAFHTAFEKHFDTPPRTILIPAKRRIQTVRHMAEQHQEVLPDGIGVLVDLFKAKNREEASHHRISYERIVLGFKTIAHGFEFDIHVDNGNQIRLQFRKIGGLWLSADNCGIGLQDLLIILYFSIASQFDVLLIEEPESHLHPEMQRKLIQFLKLNTDKQFFISTHSSVFLNTQYADRVFTCRFEESVKVQNATSKAGLLTELGYSIADNLVADLVVLCEGPTDKSVLEIFFGKMGLLDKYIIKIWLLGGDVMDKLDFTVFSQYNHVVVLLDRDPGSARIRQNVENKCKANSIPCHRFKRYSLENYFSLSAIRAVFKGQIPADLSELKPDEKVSGQLGMDIKNNNHKIAQHMTLEDVKDTDFGEFLEKVKAIVSSTPPTEPVKP